MRQATGILTIETRGPGLIDMTDRLAGWLAAEGLDGPGVAGLVSLFCRHTSASLTVQENADPAVLADLQAAMGGLAPHGGRERYAHASEGPDDMAAHIRTVLSGVHLAVPLIGGRLALGTWQAVYLWEHRDRGRVREVALHALVEG